MGITPIAGAAQLYTQGLAALAVARQNGLTSGHAMTTLVSYINHLAGQRVHVLAQGGDSIGNYAAASLQLRGQFHTSPYCKRVCALVVAGRTSNNTTPGSFTWTIGAYTLPTLYVGGAVSGTAGPGDLSVITTTLQSASGVNLAGDTDYDWQLNTGSVPTAIVYYVIFEVPRDALNSSTELTPTHDPFQIGAPILDRDIARIGDTLWKIYGRSGIPHFSHSTFSNTTPSANATFKNVLDGSTAGYSSSGAGFWTIPYRKQRFGSTTLNVVLWHVGNTDPLGAATDGVVRWVNAGGTIGSITGINTSASTIRTTTATIDATTSGSQLVIVEHSSATSTMFTRGCGMYELI